MGLRKITDGNGDTQLSELTRSGRLQASATAKMMKIWPENRRKGLYEPENAIFGPIFDFPRLPREKRRENEENSVQQAVPGYDPQVVAMQWPFLAAKVYSTAVGRA